MDFRYSCGIDEGELKINEYLFNAKVLDTVPEFLSVCRLSNH
jgi:hypothetical protein